LFSPDKAVHLGVSVTQIETPREFIGKTIAGRSRSMADTIFKRGTKNDSDQQVDVDLTDMKSLADMQKDFVRNLEEQNRGTIGKITILMIALMVLLLLTIGGLIAIFKSSAEAQVYASSVTVLMEAVTRLANVVVWPVMLYYFLRNVRKL
jgi:hypothetical protein